MKIDNGHFFNIEPVIDLEHFIELLLIMLIDDKGFNFITQKREWIANIPSNLLEQIENIMYSQDEEIILFLQLIDSYQYYEKQLEWEITFTNTFKKYLQKINKTIKYDFQCSSLEVGFEEEEIQKILEQYDEKTLEIMQSFCEYLTYQGPVKHCFNLLLKEKKRMKRKYIKTSEHTYSNNWHHTEKRKIKKANITINPQYIKKN